MIRLLHRFRATGWTRAGAFSTVVLGGVLLPACTLAEETVTFGFAPPEGTTFVETVTHTKSMQLGAGRKESSKSQGKARYLIGKAPWGYAVNVTPIMPPRERTDRDTSDMANAMLQALEITYDLDESGKILRARGAQESFERIEGLMPKELWEIAKMAMGASGKTMDQMAVEMWKSRELFVPLVGKTMETGVALEGEAPLATPTGVVVPTQITFEARILDSCERFCTHLRVTQSYQDDAFGGQLASSLRALFFSVALAASDPATASAETDAFLAEIPTMQMTDTQVRKTQERVFEAVTGLPLSIHDNTTMDGRFRVGDEVDRFVFEYDYRYDYAYE